MKNNSFFFFILALLVYHAHGANEPTVMDDTWFTFVSVTPTNVILKSTPRGVEAFVIGPDIDKTLKANIEFTIPLDKEVTFSEGRHIRIIYTPVHLTNQQKGFRRSYLVDNRRGGYNAIVTYVALSDVPEQVDESEVVMILEKGEWLKFEDAESLDITKLRWKHESFINNLDTFNPETIASLSTNLYFGPRIAELIEKKIITSSAEMIAALINAGFLPSDIEPDENLQLTPFFVPEELAQKNETALPPSSHPSRRAWLWWLALPVVAGAWFVFYLKKWRK